MKMLDVSKSKENLGENIIIAVSLGQNVNDLKFTVIF